MKYVFTHFKFSTDSVYLHYLFCYSKANAEAQEKANSSFLQSAISGSDSDYGGFLEGLRSGLDESYARAVRRNHETSMQKCEGILDSLFQDIGAKLAEGYFLRCIFNRSKVSFYS